MLAKDFILSKNEDSEYPFQSLAEDRLKGFKPLTKKEESYRYFSLNKLFSQPFTLSKKPIEKVLNSSDEITCDNLSNIYTDYKLLIDNHYKKLIREEKDFFTLLSYRFASDPLFIYVPSGVCVEEPLDIQTIIESQLDSESFFSNILIFLGKGSKLSVKLKNKERNLSLFSKVVTAHLDEGAQLSIESDLTEIDNTWFFESFRAYVKARAQFIFMGASLGGTSIRQDFNVDLEGEESDATLKGIHILKENKKAYNHICITHKAENATSNQHFKQVIFDGGKGVFEGKIFVESQAQKTNAYQLCNSLTLGDKAEAIAKPNLEIFADDVKASHGATCSQLQSDEIFYLLSRGLAKTEARKFLIEGFCREIADNFSSKEIKCNLLESLK